MWSSDNYVHFLEHHHVIHLLAGWKPLLFKNVLEHVSDERSSAGAKEWLLIGQEISRISAGSRLQQFASRVSRADICTEPNDKICRGLAPHKVFPKAVN